MKQQLIIYAKSPIPGYAKTRLGTGIGEEASAGVYARLLYTYLNDLILNQQRLNFGVTLSLASPEDVHFFASAFPEFEVRAQCEGDLGKRMENSFQNAFSSQAAQAILTGSDIPSLNFQLLQHAFSLLEHNDVVLGPAADGGYYLLGMNAPGYPLFENIHWSTSAVLQETLQHIGNNQLSVSLLPEKSDLDTARDYQEWRNAQERPQRERELLWKDRRKKVWTARS